jgi:hypothetical protein
MGDIGKPVRETERPAPVRAPPPEPKPEPAPAPVEAPPEREPVKTSRGQATNFAAFVSTNGARS